MKNSAVLSIALSITLFSTSSIAQEFNQEQAAADAKATVKAFGDALKDELIAAMKAGGPGYALGVCNIEAMPITARLSQDKDATISRVSLKNRNPGNVPNEWQRLALEEFDARVKAGEDIAPMASMSVVELNGKRQVRFMKAVPTDAACLACHGQQIAPDVQAKLDSLYPQDKATGYSQGQVRGAIVVVKDY